MLIREYVESRDIVTVVVCVLSSPSGKRRSNSPHEGGDKGKKRVSQISWNLWGNVSCPSSLQVKLSSSDIREMSREKIISRSDSPLLPLSKSDTPLHLQMEGAGGLH